MILPNLSFRPCFVVHAVPDFTSSSRACLVGATLVISVRVARPGFLSFLNDWYPVQRIEVPREAAEHETSKISYTKSGKPRKIWIEGMKS
jgi:hypothetical protein